MRCLLRGFGMEWRSHSEAFLWRPHLTKETKSFNFFFSHDWDTSGWLKYFTILCFLNGTAAATAAFVGGLSFGLLAAFEVLPNTFGWNAMCATSHFL